MIFFTIYSKIKFNSYITAVTEIIIIIIIVIIIIIIITNNNNLNNNNRTVEIMINTATPKDQTQIKVK